MFIHKIKLITTSQSLHLPEPENEPSFKFLLLCRFTEPPVAPRILDKSLRESDTRKLD